MNKRIINNIKVCLLNYKLIEKHQTKIKFVIVGVWNTIFGYLVFILLDSLFTSILSRRYLAYMSAMIIGQVIATTNAFIFHKYITFKSTIKGKRLMIEFFRFCLTYVVTFILGLVLMPFFVEIFDIKPKIAALIIIFICTIISYFGHSRYSFKS